MKIINLLLCFLLGIFIHIFLKIEGFEDKICVPNKNSTNCSNAYNNVCKSLCVGRDVDEGCPEQISSMGYCKIDKTKKDDCCIPGKPGLCPGSFRVLNEIEKSSTTKKKTPDN